MVVCSTRVEKAKDRQFCYVGCLALGMTSWVAKGVSRAGVWDGIGPKASREAKRRERKRKETEEERHAVA
jgi:2-keto-3-deoxy-6-phosphogluconate aldolase